jgi:CRP-like cAMP-binding protein
MLIMEPGEVLAKLVDFPIRVFEQGDVVLSEGSATGRLLFLKQGLVDIVMEGVDLTRVSEPGAVFGEIGVLLGQAHTADVMAVQPSSFYVVESADEFLRAEPLVALYIAMVLAQRLNVVNHLVIEARSRAAEAGQRRGFLVDTLDRLGRALQIRTPR